MHPDIFPSYSYAPSPPLHLYTLPTPLPPRPPPLLPPPTLKLLLPQLPINLIMRLTHPPAQLPPPPHPRPIPLLRHPLLEILGAGPAGVEAREEVQELGHFALLGGGCGGGVGGGEGVEEGPG